MLEALDRYFPEETSWSKPDGGMSVWVRLPAALSSRQLLHQAAETGVTFITGDHFFASSPQENALRLSFTMASPQAIDDAVKKLGALVKTQLSKNRKQRGTARPDGLRALV
jgi:DNA-binding transcriptional MocR family regulator